MSKTRILAFLGFSALLVTIGVYITCASILLSFVPRWIGSFDPWGAPIYDLKEMIRWLSWLLPQTGLWLSFPPQGWMLVAFITPIVVASILYLVYRKIVNR